MLRPSTHRGKALGLIGVEMAAAVHLIFGLHVSHHYYLSSGIGDEVMVVVNRNELGWARG